MNYGDLSSLVQLGVGLHAGAALLQMYGGAGIARLVRSIDRARSLLPLITQNQSDSLIGEFFQLEGDYDIFRVRLHNEHMKYLFFNSAIAVVLVGVLIFISIMAQEKITESWSAVLIIALSIIPAIVTIFSLSLDVRRRLKPLKEKADSLEEKMLRCCQLSK